MTSTKKADTQPRGKSFACTGKLPELQSSASRNPAQVMCFIQFPFSFVSALTFQLPVVRSTEEGTCSNLLPPPWAPLSGSSSVIVIKQLIIIKRIKTNGKYNMGRGKNQTSPQTSGDRDHEGNMCVLHTTATLQRITQQQLPPHPSSSVLDCTSHYNQKR